MERKDQVLCGKCHLEKIYPMENLCDKCDKEFEDGKINCWQCNKAPADTMRMIFRTHAYFYCMSCYYEYQKRNSF